MAEIVALIGVIVGFLIMMLGISLGIFSSHPNRHLVPFWAPEKLFLGGFLLLIIMAIFVFLF